LGLLAKTFYYLNILIILAVVLIHLGQYVCAISGYDSGYNHGCNDAKVADSSQRYINQSGKGPNFHSNAFMQGYESGLSSCSVDQSNGLLPSKSPNQAPPSPMMTNQGDETSFGVVIIIAILVIISSVASNATNGQMSPLDPKTGVVNYNPRTGYVGNDSYTFQATDSHGAKSNIGQVSITVFAPEPIGSYTKCL
jgi:Bacterial Ig domain